MADRKILAPLVEQRVTVFTVSQYQGRLRQRDRVVTGPPALQTLRFQSRLSKVMDRQPAKKSPGTEAPGLSLRHWDQKQLYSTFLAVLAVACSTGLEALRAIATYIALSFDISDMWVSYAFLAH